MAVVVVEDRAFVPWLVVAPTEAELLRARHITPAQINRLEEAWKGNPKATVDDIDKPGEDDEPAHVALKWVLHLEHFILSHCVSSHHAVCTSAAMQSPHIGLLHRQFVCGQHAFLFGTFCTCC